MYECRASVHAALIIHVNVHCTRVQAHLYKGEYIQRGDEKQALGQVPEVLRVPSVHMPVNS